MYTNLRSELLKYQREGETVITINTEDMVKMMNTTKSQERERKRANNIRIIEEIEKIKRDKQTHTEHTSIKRSDVEMSYIRTNNDELEQHMKAEATTNMLAHVLPAIEQASTY